jgi:hypothetical protein
MIPSISAGGLVLLAARGTHLVLLHWTLSRSTLMAKYHLALPTSLSSQESTSQTTNLVVQSRLNLAN